MKQTKQRFILLALTALLALFAGCKGESPTAPPPITGTSGGGTGGAGAPPPVGSNIVLTATTTAPFTASTSTITATVTLNNAPVANGTAVEFATTTPNANFTDTADNPTTLIRTTTAGIAKITVTSSVAQPVVVTATVNNVTKSITLTFQDPTTPIIPPSTAPVITAVTPANGLPAGNQTVVITGSNFRAPVRVLFDPGNGIAAKEAFATLVSPTQINVISPAFDLGVSQQLVVSITVIVEAGAPTEQRTTKAAAFTYTAPVLTPVVRALSPTSGPIDGGTRISIIGDAFEAPVQVFFGSAQATVLTVTFHEIDVMSPAARDTAPNGSGAVTGPVDIKVVDVNSGKSVVAASAFRYVNKAQITAITPNQGPFTGGTRFTIDGTGFVDPVAVVLDGIAASVIKVSGTQIIGISSPIAISSCADSSGPVVVTNIDNGDSATGPIWIYRVLKPVIVSVTSTPVPLGGIASVRVANASGFPRITLGTTGVNITSQTDNGDGTTTFTIQVPNSLTLTTASCPGAAGASAPQPTAFDVTYTSLTTTCTDTLKGGLLVTPPATPTLTLVPTAFAPFSATITPPVPPSVTPTVTNPPPQTVTIVNTGAGPLSILSVTTSGAGCGNAPGQISVTVPSPQTLSTCDTAPITASYKGTTAPSNAQCTVTINSNDLNHSPKILQITGSSQ
ncbi:MAG TPA: IPT/TIG domain-containing protein [Thermoanaerobaculia bacterium]|nr:IPT/TIG domain-containing protein [Thermoanaerobaculia bacterium]